VIVWPREYERFYDELLEDGPFEVHGRVVEEYGTYSLVAGDVRAVAWSPAIIDLRRASEKLARSFTNTQVYPAVASRAA
jgi:hypothetical protein